MLSKTDVKTEELLKKIEELFEDASEKTQRQAMYKVILQNAEGIQHNSMALYRIENMMGMMNRENKRFKEEGGDYII